MRTSMRNVLKISQNPDLWGKCSFKREDIQACLQADLIEQNGATDENTWAYDLTDRGRKAIS